MEYTSIGKGNAALTTGIIGTAGVGLGLLGNLLGGGWNNGCACNGNAVSACGCSENSLVNRYEAQQQARIAELETEVKLRDSNIYTDSKILEVYRYFDGELKSVRSALCEQAVQNEKVSGAFALVRSDLQRERDERCCADNKIVNYVNATFYPKLVADITPATTTTVQELYNPLCGCCGSCS